ncbi:TetR/AcrR family transcriptional regulator [Sphingomonas psychrotolerans]|uniref:TetR family transcriptional regulator n=1 Tax=Sphingomonas psychrotolerans TaxID=1327635 RepID=A0A2K8MHE6_9SPHN|nr:TetR family transcriptional regulator [Sphingomonas psychrotolerans]ATY33318.1 TetR family transcriptional regulator [Sphingomonas psychrotolerans]
MPTKVRGRPRSFDPDEALQRAAERFRTFGFAGTSLDELSEATGLARPSLAAAFGDKRALYIAAIERLMARVERQLIRLGEARLPPRELVERLLLGGINLYLTGSDGPEGCLIINTAATQAASDPLVREKVGAFLKVEDDRIAELLAAAGSPAPEAQGRLVASVLHSLSVRARAGASREELEQVVRDCVDLIAGAGN